MLLDCPVINVKQSSRIGWRSGGYNGRESSFDGERTYHK